jgi:hypothetical protein
LSWRQLHGEELVATTMEVLDAQGRSGSRLPWRLHVDLRLGAFRRRAAAWPTFWVWNWWVFTGLGFDRIDRWRARDCDLDHVLAGRWAVLLFAVFLFVPRPTHGWPYLALDWGIVALVVLVVAINMWRSATGALKVRRRTKAARLAAFGFTLGGVPYEWLPGRPPPSDVGWQSPPVTG